MDDLKPKRKKKSKKGLVLFIFILIAALGIFFYWKYYFVLGEGVKAGELNQIVYKGTFYKTYEGKLIQPGLRADKPGGIQSNQFEFSVVDVEIADSLMKESGKNVQLHYKEYNGTLPWRGHTRYVVDSIISIQQKYPQQGIFDQQTQEVLPLYLENS
ncbi:MAG: hypothetical protein WCR12_00645 [Dysgonamonadaceae bacterium]